MVLGRNPQLLSAARIGEMCSGSLKEKEAWQRGTCGQRVVCSQSPGCWPCCTQHLWEERGADGDGMGTHVYQGNRCVSRAG